MNEMVKRARTIQEKRGAYQERASVDYSHLKEWRSARTLLKDKFFKEMLSENGMTEEEFAFSLQPEVDPGKLAEDEWYYVYSEIMKDFNEEDIDITAGVGLPALPFSIYFNNKMKEVISNLNYIKVSEKASEAFIQSQAAEMFNITGKLTALNLAYYKENHKFRARNEKSRFNEYLKNAFGRKENFISFYEKYPVAARVATVRTLYLIKNYTDILMHLDTDHCEIEKFIGSKNLNITDLKLSTGDSHAKGNSVSIIMFGDKKLVYKPKNLKINEAFESFVDWYTNASGMLAVRIPRGIYKDSYTYNEFIEKRYCKSEEEVKNFYTRYGYLVAICYLLNINDLHLENIIAHGEHPIIIDMETLFQLPAKIGEESAFYDLAKKLELDSVACSLLLPKQLHVGTKDAINLSAFNGSGGEMLQEVLVPKDVNTSEFHYGNVKGHFAEGDNIPQYSENEDVDVSKYSLVIIEAFEEFMRFIMTHKDETLEALEAFRGKRVRSLLKSTERYASMIRYANHPNYNMDMKYRERLMMNIWSYPYRDKRVVKSEVRDLLFNDIPIFFSYTDSRDIIDSHGEVYPAYHSISGYEATRRKILELSDKSIDFQKTIMQLAFGIMDKYLNKQVEKSDLLKEIKEIDYIKQAQNLADKKMLEAHEKDDECSFINLDCDKSKHWGLLACTPNLYDGLSGIAVVYLELYRATKEDRYLDFYRKLMRVVIKQIKTTAFESAFTGWLSPVYPMILEKNYTNSVCDLDYLKDTVKHLEAMKMEQLNKLEHHDYIAGYAGIIRLTRLVQEHFPELELSDETVDKFINLTMEKFRLAVEKGEDKAGMAHGISGIVYGIVSGGKYDKEVVKKMLDYEYRLGIEPQNDYKWCWGYPGMIQARIAISRIDSDCVNKKQLNSLIGKFEKLLDKVVGSDTLCHGNGSIVTTLKMLYDYTNDEKWKNYLDMWLTNISMSALFDGHKVSRVSDIESKGVFDGIYGVVWMYLYATGNVNNILLMETRS